jgi:DNA-binding NtrC family response regulator
MTPAKVLIIDDEHMIRWSVAQTLRAAGHEVALAGTAAEGLALFREFRPDVVFLDVRLPDSNGLTVLQSVKVDQGRDTAVVVMTAHDEDVGSAAEVLRRGAFAYLKKPFDFDRLPLIVAEAVGGRQSSEKRCG